MFGRPKKNRKTKKHHQNHEAMARIKSFDGVREISGWLEVPQSVFGQFSWGLVDQVCREYGLRLRITHEDAAEPSDPVFAVTVRRAARREKVADRAKVGIMNKLGLRSF